MNYVAVLNNITFSTDKLSWGDARAACKKKGMDLAVLETEKENICVTDRLELLGNYLI